MKKDVVLVVEPENSPVRHMKLLDGECRLEAFSSLKEGFAAYIALRPVAVLVSLQQREGHGFQLTQALRQQAGPTLPIIAYGRPTVQQRRTLLLPSSAQLQEKWGFDRYLAREPSVSDLDILLRGMMVGGPLGTDELTAETEEAPAILRTRRVTSAARSAEEVAAQLSWSELLRSDFDRQVLHLMWLKLTGRRQAA